MPFTTAAKDVIKNSDHPTLPTSSLANLLDNLKQLIGELKFKVISGGSAGNHTVTGIAAADSLAVVLQMIGAGTDVTDVADLTSEFTITAADTINNTSGTDTTGDKLVVVYFDLT